MASRRSVVLALVAAVVPCLITLQWLSLSKPPDPGPDLRWLSLSKPPQAGVLSRWDHLRARAYSTGDAAALRRLYAQGSQAGARDVRVLRSYVARGLVVTGLRMWLHSVEVVHSSRHRLVLLVHDRLVHATARSRTDHTVRRLPTDHPSTHVITLIRPTTHHQWQVFAVR